MKRRKSEMGDKYGRPWRITYRGTVVDVKCNVVFTLQKNDMELKKLIVTAVNEQFAREQKEKE